jgi:hypothetical protein
MASFDQDDLKTTGIPSDRLINLYSKWAHGGFGLISTGNIIIGIILVGSISLIKSYYFRPFTY